MKIGVCLTTYQRFDRFIKCFSSLAANIKCVAALVIVEDCSVMDRPRYDSFFSALKSRPYLRVVRNRSNLGVGASKNIGMRLLYESGCTHIFTLEDDMLILSPDVFSAYADSESKTGFEYLNFAHQAEVNLNGGRHVNYKGCPLAIYTALSGAFTLHTRNVLERVGYHDSKFFNAWEHFEYCYRASLLGLTAPFWQFADIVDSEKYLKGQTHLPSESSICRRSDWKENILRGRIHFQRKHGFPIESIPRSPPL